MALVKAVAVVDNVINELSFRCIVLGNSVYATLLFNPVQSFVNHINSKDRRCIVQRIVIGKGAVFQHCRQLLACCSQKAFLGNDDDYAGRTKIFLRSCVDKVKILNVRLARKNVAGHIADNGNIKLGEILVFGAVNRVVGSEVYIRSIGAEREFLWNVAVVLISAASGLINLAVEFSFCHSLFGPDAGVDISGVFFSVEISSCHQKLSAAAALDEHNLVIFGDFHQLAQQLFCFCVQGSVFVAAVAHFNDAHAGVFVV